MPMQTIEMYHRELPRLKAELELLQYRASSLVWLDKNKQRRRLKQLERQASGGYQAGQKQKPNRAQLALMGIKVVKHAG